MLILLRIRVYSTGAEKTNVNGVIIAPNGQIQKFVQIGLRDVLP